MRNLVNFTVQLGSGCVISAKSKCPLHHPTLPARASGGPLTPAALHFEGEDPFERAMRLKRVSPKLIQGSRYCEVRRTEGIQALFLDCLALRFALGSQ